MEGPTPALHVRPRLFDDVTIVFCSFHAVLEPCLEAFLACLKSLHVYMATTTFLSCNAAASWAKSFVDLATYFSISDNWHGLAVLTCTGFAVSAVSSLIVASTTCNRF